MVSRSKRRQNRPKECSHAMDRSTYQRGLAQTAAVLRLRAASPAWWPGRARACPRLDRDGGPVPLEAIGLRPQRPRLVGDRRHVAARQADLGDLGGLGGGHRQRQRHVWAAVTGAASCRTGTGRTDSGRDPRLLPGPWRRRRRSGPLPVDASAPLIRPARRRSTRRRTPACFHACR